MDGCVCNWSEINPNTSTVSHHTRSVVTPGTSEAKPETCGEPRASSPERDTFLAEELTLDKEWPPALLKDMTNDKDMLRRRSFPSGQLKAKDSERGKEDLLLASFLALALDLILSACRFLSSSSVSPEAATTLSSSHQHCQFGHLRTCAQAIQSDTLAGAKKLSNVFIIIIIITFFVLSSPL